MKKVFVDCDVILDLLMERQPFYSAAAELFSLVERKKIHAFVSPAVIANLHYILARSLTSAKARAVLNKFSLLIRILPMDEEIIRLALNSDFRDFEDAIQYYTALNHGIPLLITRNKKDYAAARITILTAEEFLAVSG